MTESRIRTVRSRADVGRSIGVPTPIARTLLAIAFVLGCNAGPSRAEPRVESPAAPQVVAVEPLDFVERCVGASCDDELPTLVVIHGLGDTPESFVEVYTSIATPVRILALRAPIPWGGGYAWFPYRSRATSHETIAEALRGVVPRVLATIDHVCAMRRCRGRPIVSGFSQGGMASYALAALAPSRFRAAYPISGFFATGLDPVSSTEKPFIRGFHGGADDVVSADADRAGAARLRAAGYEVELTVLEGVRHTIPAAIRAELLRDLEQRLAQ